MNCFNHPESVSVAVCQDCQKGLCDQCASTYSIPICDQCNALRKRNRKRSIYKELLLMFVFGCIGYYLLLKVYNPVDSTLLKVRIFDKVFVFVAGFYLGGAIVSGWKTLNKLTPNVFLFLPIIGWLLFFIVKFLLSIAVGLLMFPVRLFMNLRRLYLLYKRP